jgi:hypothetical protein
MGKDRKHMKKIREKRIKSVEGQIGEHKEKIEHEKGRKDTTKDYWEKEINEKFLKQIEKDEEYLEENKK